MSQRVGSGEERIRWQTPHVALVTETEKWQGASVATITDGAYDVHPDTDTNAEMLIASGTGWAIDLQETRRLMRIALAAPSARHRPNLPVGESDARVPNLGLRPVVLTVLCCLFLLLVVGALDGMQQYARIHAQVDDALNHLRAAQSLLDARQPGQPLTAATLAQVAAQISTAQSDFAELRTELGNPSGVVLLGTFVPHLTSRIAAAANLARAGNDACQGLSDVVTATNDLLALRSDGFLDANGQLTRKGRLSPVAAMLLLHARQALTIAIGPLDAAAHAIAPADLAVLPPTLASSADLATLSGVVARWPQTRAGLLAPDGWRLLLPLVLGTQSPAH